MMKRVLAALAALCIASAAQARVMIVDGRTAVPNSILGVEQSTNYVSRKAVILSVIDKMGGAGNYVVVDSRNIATEYARTGVMVWPNGTAETMDGVIFMDDGASLSSTSRCRADSGTFVARGGPQVPQLHLLGDYVTIASQPYIAGGLKDSIGIAVSDVATNPSNMTPASYLYSDRSIRWLNHTYTSGFVLNQAAVIPGGIRKLVGSTSCGMNINRETVNSATNSAWADSMPFQNAATDTVLVWDRLWANLASCPTAKAAVYAYWGGGGLVADSIYNAGYSLTRNGSNEGCIQTLAFALAHFDSLIGGKLFNKGAAARAIVVRGGLSRGLQRWQGGIAPQDTAVFYAVMRDSVNAYGIPLTVAINPDSATTYARDLIVLKGAGSIRFAPYVTDGVLDSTTAGLGVTNGGRLVDVWGRFRNRAFYGDSLTHSIQTSDTSLVWGLRRQLAMVDSLTGGRVVRLAVPPVDDWSPKSFGSGGGGSRLDSLLWAINKAGYVGVLANGQFDEANGNTNKGPGYTNPRGWINRQGNYQWSLGGSVGNVRVLTHYGSSMGMGLTQEFLGSDSTFSASKSDGWIRYYYHELDRTYGAWFNEQWGNYDEWQPFASSVGLTGTGDLATFYDVRYPKLDIVADPPKRAYVERLFCSDMAGTSSGVPPRNGWWVIKSIWQNFRAINAAHGVYGPVVRLGYANEVQP